MKAEVKVSAVQFSVEHLQLEKNIERMRTFVAAEAEKGAELIVFPELANIGYIKPTMPGESLDPNESFAECASRYWRAAETIPGPTTEALLELTKKYNVYVVVGMAQQHPTITGTLYNSAVLLGPNGIIGVHHKMHIPLGEKHYFYPGCTSEVFQTELGKIGMLVCYDGRFPELSRILALKGAEIICSGWNISGGFGSVTPDMNSVKYRAYTRAQENGVYFIASSRSGYQGDVYFIGHSAIASPNGTIIASSETIEEDVVRAVLKEEELLNYRCSLNIFRDRRPEMYDLVTKPLSEPFKEL
jgi:predicted amidohydrolase